MLILGTPGGTTTATTVFQITTGVIDFGLPLQDVVEAPRFHHQWDVDRLYYEAGFSCAAAESLERMGWDTRRRSGTSGAAAAIQITYENDTRRIIGARDPRRDITPVGK